MTVPNPDRRAATHSAAPVGLFAATILLLLAAVVSLVISVAVVRSSSSREKSRTETLLVQLRAQGNRLELLATDAASAAHDARALLAEIEPCDPGDDPASPGCKRAARSDALVGAALQRINDALAGGIAAHDLNAHRQHEELARRLGVTSALTRPTPITAAPRPTTTTTRPATTTTTCPRLPNGRCRP